MKIHAILFILSIFLFLSCNKNDIELFDGKNQLFFEKYFEDEEYPGTQEADSTLVSFFNYPDGTQSIPANLNIKLSGKALLKDTKFKIKLVEDETTAKPEEYTIAENYQFQANKAKNEDTDKELSNFDQMITIEMNLSERLKTMEDGVVLVVEIVPDSFFNLGQTERTKAKIRLKYTGIQPDWWDTEVSNNLLGNYSDKKYKLFLNNADTKSEMSKELITANPARAIELVMNFKIWLNNQIPAIEEDNGSLMTVQL